MKILNRLWPPLIPLVLVTGVLEILVQTRVVESYILPSPLSVASSLLEDRVELFGGFFQTMTSAFYGLVLSALVGVFAAVVLSLSDFLRRAMLPYAVFFQTVPIVALAPVLVIWFGFGQPTVIASAFIVSLFPVIANGLLGLASTDRDLLDLFRINRATKLMTLTKLKLPSALPAIMGGLRIASGLAVIGAVVGEFIAGGGLGEVVDAARTQQRLDRVFAAVVLSALLGLVFVVAIDSLSRWLLASWHESERT